MKIGFNYPVSHNRFGSQIGPNLWVGDSEWDKFSRDAQEGRVNDIPLPPMFDNIDRNLSNLKKMGFTVVRWFLLGNGNNYGPAPTPYHRARRIPAGLFSYVDYVFTPPSQLDLRFTRDFAELLVRFKKADLQIIPSLISFEFTSAQRYTSGPRQNTAAAGRADIIRDPAKRKTFLDTMLAELLRVSIPFREQIYAWEIANEPIWMALDFGPNSWPQRWRQHEPEVTFGELNAFLDDAVARIDAQKFPSSVGHRYFADLTRFNKGALPQFHYYADNGAARRAIAAVTNYESDPARIEKNLFSGSPKPFVGEFPSDAIYAESPWTADLPRHDTTFERLKLLENQGCELALIWIDANDHDKRVVEGDILKLQLGTRKAIVDFTGGSLPPPSE